MEVFEANGVEGTSVGVPTRPLQGSGVCTRLSLESI